MSVWRRLINGETRSLRVGWRRRMRPGWLLVLSMECVLFRVRALLELMLLYLAWCPLTP